MNTIYRSVAQRELTGESELDRQDVVLATLDSGLPWEVPPPRRASAWTDAELDESIVSICDEFPGARMAACWRALEHCRRMTPRGTPESLLVAMRAALRRDQEMQSAALAA